jgi:adenosylcobinamide amidohydrolase
MGVGALNEIENWKNIATDNSIIRKQIVKTSDYIGITTKFNDYVNLMLTLYYQGGFDQEDWLFRNRISSDFQLKIKVTNKIALLTSLSFQYEDKPIIPIQQLVYSVTNGFIWDF